VGTKKERSMSSERKKVGVDLGLTDDEKQELRRIARTVIESKSRGKPLSPSSPTTEKLKEGRGAFVCIYKQGMLRGCIGSLDAADPLHKTVEEMAQAAAFRDPRFTPVSEDELPYLDMEISVLTPLTEIHDREEIEVGKHGIMIRKGVVSGLLLPQVATERNWDRITFLQETCRKAGLPRDAWKDKETKIYVFSADVF
jgi:AmmeMemoRadiSam system protein A